LECFPLEIAFSSLSTIRMFPLHIVFYTNISAVRMLPPRNCFLPAFLQLERFPLDVAFASISAVRMLPSISAVRMLPP